MRRPAVVDRFLSYSYPTGPDGEKVGVDDYLVKHGREPLTALLKTAWPYDPALNDHDAAVYWHL